MRKSCARSPRRGQCGEGRFAALQALLDADPVQDGVHGRQGDSRRDAVADERSTVHPDSGDPRPRLLRPQPQLRPDARQGTLGPYPGAHLPLDHLSVPS
jgi:hypothetical protein